MRDLLEFYRHERPTDEGYRLGEILAWPDHRLEEVHTYIQWLFPLPERSGANPSAPVLDAEAIAEFRRDAALRKQLRTAFERMLRFYGFALENTASELRVARTPEFAQQARNWLTPGNHNHLRITRILRSLTVLGLEPEARAFLQALEAVAAEFPERVSAVSLGFWTRAI